MISESGITTGFWSLKWLEILRIPTHMGHGDSWNCTLFTGDPKPMSLDLVTLSSLFGDGVGSFYFRPFEKNPAYLKIMICCCFRTLFAGLHNFVVSPQFRAKKNVMQVLLQQRDESICLAKAPTVGLLGFQQRKSDPDLKLCHFLPFLCRTFKRDIYLL